MAEGEKVDIGGQYKDLRGLRSRFEEELQEALRSGEVEKAKTLRGNLEWMIEGIREQTDPFKVKLRDEIAKEFGYSYVGPFSPEGIARAQQGDEFKFVDKKGTDLFGKRFTDARDFVEERAIVTEAGFNPGILKPDGELIITALEGVHDFSGEYALVEPQPDPSRIGYSFVDKFGVLISIFDFDDARSFREGIAWVKVVQPGGENGWQMLNTNLELSKAKFRDAADFSEGLASVLTERNTKPFSGPASTETIAWYIDKSGQKVLPKKKGFWNRNPHYNFAGKFSEGLAWVIGDDFSGVINKDGETVFSTSFVSAEPFSDGLSLVGVLSHPNIFFMNRKGVHAIESGPKRERILRAKSFQESIGAIKILTGWYFINTSGDPVHDQSFTNIIDPFNNGVAKVARDQDTFYVDKRGRRLFSNG